MTVMRTLLVDDEPLARDCIRLALEEVEDIEIIAECSDGSSAVAAIEQLEPDLVFLDVQMPGIDGFGVIEAIGPANMPPIIFVTAFDRHAIRAFEIHAMDYVLKPFDDERVHDAVRHARDRIRATRTDELASRIAALIENRRDRTELRRIPVRERDRIRYIDIGNADYFEADGNYVRLHVGTTSHLVRATMSGLETRLDNRFVRIHRSTIVNLDRVAEVQPWSGGDYIARLQNGGTLRISRKYRDTLLKSTL